MDYSDIRDSYHTDLITNLLSIQRRSELFYCAIFNQQLRTLLLRTV